MRRSPGSCWARSLLASPEPSAGEIHSHALGWVHLRPCCEKVFGGCHCLLSRGSTHSASGRGSLWGHTSLAESHWAILTALTAPLMNPQPEPQISPQQFFPNFLLTAVHCSSSAVSQLQTCVSTGISVYFFPPHLSDNVGCNAGIVTTIKSSMLKWNKPPTLKHWILYQSKCLTAVCLAILGSLFSFGQMKWAFPVQNPSPAAQEVPRAPRPREAPPPMPVSGPPEPARPRRRWAHSPCARHCVPHGQSRRCGLGVPNSRSGTRAARLLSPALGAAISGRSSASRPSRCQGRDRACAAAETRHGRRPSAACPGGCAAAALCGGRGRRAEDQLRCPQKPSKINAKHLPLTLPEPNKPPSFKTILKYTLYFYVLYLRSHAYLYRTLMF